MARAGIELWQIQLFARWESAVILRYVREAPLARSHLAGKMANVKDLTEMVDDTEGALPKLQEQEGDAWSHVLNQKLGDALGGEIKVDSNKDGKQLISDTVSELLKAQDRSDKTPQCVVNCRMHYSKTRAHIPRDSCSAFCGWGWAAAAAEGKAIEITEEASIGYFKCNICARGAAARMSA